MIKINVIGPVFIVQTPKFSIQSGRDPKNKNKFVTWVWPVWVRLGGACLIKVPRRRYG